MYSFEFDEAVREWERDMDAAAAGFVRAGVPPLQARIMAREAVSRFRRLVGTIRDRGDIIGKLKRGKDVP